MSAQDDTEYASASLAEIGSRSREAAPGVLEEIAQPIEVLAGAPVRSRTGGPVSAVDEGGKIGEELDAAFNLADDPSPVIDLVPALLRRSLVMSPIAASSIAELGRRGRSGRRGVATISERSTSTSSPTGG